MVELDRSLAYLSSGSIQGAITRGRFLERLQSGLTRISAPLWTMDLVRTWLDDEPQIAMVAMMGGLMLTTIASIILESRLRGQQSVFQAELDSRMGNMPQT